MTDSSRYSINVQFVAACERKRQNEDDGSYQCREPVRRSGFCPRRRASANEAHYRRDNIAANDGHDDKDEPYSSVLSRFFDTQREDGRHWIDINALHNVSAVYMSAAKGGNQTIEHGKQGGGQHFYAARSGCPCSPIIARVVPAWRPQFPQRSRSPRNCASTAQRQWRIRDEPERR